MAANSYPVVDRLFRRFFGGSWRWLVAVAPAAAAMDAAERFLFRWVPSLCDEVESWDVIRRLIRIPPSTSFDLSR